MGARVDVLLKGAVEPTETTEQLTAPTAEAGGTEPLAVRAVLSLLRQELGEVEPWPASCDLEYVCGAILVQNTAWTNVQTALSHLGPATGFEPERILALEDETLTALIRPSGFMRAKGRALRAYCAWLLTSEGAQAGVLDDAELRESLLALPGIGPETADVIALMVFGRRRFIFDAYGRRLLRQAGYEVDREYERARRRLEPLIEEAALSHSELVEVHGLILESGKRARAAGGWEVYGSRIGIEPVADGVVSGREG